MRGCLLTLALFALIIVGFLVGAASSQSVLMIVAFFAYTPVVLLAGWTLKGLFSNRRIAFVEVERGAVANRQPGSSTRARRLQVPEEARAQETL